MNFNEELLQLEKPIGDCVIVHELLHFRYPNHGRVWKSLMTAYLGDYEKAEKKLKKIVDKKEVNNGHKMLGSFFLNKSNKRRID